MQMLWDRGESNGYAAHIADHPLPGTPKHKVLIFEAFGDHQVANVATEVMARTVGVKLRTPALAPGRSADREPFWGSLASRRIPTEARRCSCGTSARHDRRPTTCLRGVLRSAMIRTTWITARRRPSTR